ncbi:hypothetical protein AHAS_Ahas05G0137400 [Arachis hypogaea]
MNSHFGYEFGSNYVVGDGSYNGDMHQGFGNQGWEESQAYEQSSWQQPPPNSYGYNLDPNAYQSNVCDNPHCGCQPQSSHAYELPSQHSFPPYSQALPYQAPLYDPYLPYDQSSISYSYDHYEQEPIEPPQPYHDYYQEPPQYSL